MRMILIPRPDLEVKNAFELIQVLQEGKAVRRDCNLESVFHFIGIDGNVYTTNNRGTNEFILSQHEFLPAFENYNELEVFEINFLAFDNKPWLENNLMEYYRPEPTVSSVRWVTWPFNPKLQNDDDEGRVIPDYRFFNLLYPEKTNDIWIAFDQTRYDAIPVSNRLMISVLLEDNKTIITDYPTCFTTKHAGIFKQIRAYRFCSGCMKHKLKMSTDDTADDKYHLSNGKISDITNVILDNSIIKGFDKHNNIYELVTNFDQVETEKYVKILLTFEAAGEFGISDVSYYVHKRILKEDANMKGLYIRNGDVGDFWQHYYKLYDE